MRNFHLKNTVGAIVLTIATLLTSCSKKTAEPAPEEPAPLAIKSFSPKQAKVGTLVTIRGTGFGNEQSLVRIFFGGSEMVRPLQFSDTLMTAIVPPDASAGRITVSLMLGPSTQSDDLFNTIVDETDYVNLNKIQFTGSGTLSANRSYLAAAAAGNKILVVGSPAIGGLNTDHDIYDVSNNTWQSGRLSQPRTDMAVAAAGNKILVAGGTVGSSVVKIVDIYDVVSNTWTTSELSVGRTKMAAVGSGSEIFFAGGRDATGKLSDVIDVYNVSTEKWHKFKLSIARAGLVAATAGDKVVFAGGQTDQGDLNGKVIDIFDGDEYFKGNPNFWLHARFDLPRNTGMAAIGGGRYIAFAGGTTNAQDPYLDIFDAASKTWGKRTINEEIASAAAAAAGTKLVFSYGKGRALIYDILTGSITSVIHAGQAEPTVGAGIKNKIIFAGGAAFDQYTVFK